QMARNATDEGSGFLRGMRYLLHDRGTKFCAAFLDVLRSSGIRPLALPPRSPNLKDYASHCTSLVLVDETLFSARRSASLRPWALRGGLSPGCSYRQSFLSV